MIAQRILAAQTAIDVKQRRTLVEGAAVIPAAILARHQQRPKDRKAHLAAMNMAGQHEVDALLPGPNDMVWRMAQTQAKGLDGRIGEIRRRLEPRPFMTDGNERLAAHVHLLPDVAEHM